MNRFMKQMTGNGSAILTDRIRRKHDEKKREYEIEVAKMKNLIAKKESKQDENSDVAPLTSDALTPGGEFDVNTDITLTTEIGTAEFKLAMVEKRYHYLFVEEVKESK